MKFHQYSDIVIILFSVFINIHNAILKIYSWQNFIFSKIFIKGLKQKTVDADTSVGEIYI